MSFGEGDIMLIADYQRISVTEFEDFIYRPENVNRDWEFIDGRIVEVVANRGSSRYAANILGRMTFFVQEHDLGWVTGADGGYMVEGERYIPDVGYLSKARQPDPQDDVAYSPLPPDLAVEGLSPSNDPDDMRIKVVNYLRAGATVWVVNPEKHEVQVLSPSAASRTLGLADTLDGGDILPGFSLPVKDIFR
jgi:Uma2 family endonuclease